MTHVILSRNQGVEGLSGHVHVHLRRTIWRKQFAFVIFANRKMGSALGGHGSVFPCCSKAGSISDHVPTYFEMIIWASVTKIPFALCPRPADKILGLPHDGCGNCSGPKSTHGDLRAIHPPAKKKLPACIDDFFFYANAKRKTLQTLRTCPERPSRQQTPQQI